MFWRVLSGLGAISFMVQLGRLLDGGSPNRLHVGLALFGVVLVCVNHAVTGDD